VVLLAGPKGSPYEGGEFRLEVSVPTGYPLEPPKMKFITKLFHPNVGAGHTPGAICLDILRKEAWSPALTLERVLISIASLMADPNPASPMNGEAGNLYTKDRKAYDAKVREFTKKFARANSKAAGEGAWTSDFGKADDEEGEAAPDNVKGVSPTSTASTQSSQDPIPEEPEQKLLTAAEAVEAYRKVVIDLSDSEEEPATKKARTS